MVKCYRLFRPKISKVKTSFFIWFSIEGSFQVERETPFISIQSFKELLGLGKDDYPIFSEFNRSVIKPAIKEINDLTDYHIKVEQKRIGRRIGELKFRIRRTKQLPVQELLFPDIENLPPIAVELVQAKID